MFNKIIMAGNLTRDIELRYTQGGSAIANTAIATSRKFTVNGEKKEETCFVDITFFGRSAEVANQYLHKGSKVLIEGRLKLDTWNDQSGQKRSKHSIVVENMQMLGSRDTNSSENQNNQQSNYQGNSSSSENPNNYQQPPATAYQPQQMQQQPQNDPNLFDDPNDEEIPF